MALAVGAASCGLRDPVPPHGTTDARFGRLAGQADPPTKARMCRAWSSHVAFRDDYAWTHVSFPETNVQDACFTRVVHRDRDVHVGAPPRGCSYPDEAARVRLLRVAADLEALADQPLRRHVLFPCTLDPNHRAAAARHDARVLRRAAASSRTYPYAAAALPGHGTAEQDRSAVRGFVPGQGCRALSGADVDVLGAMPFRAARGADAMRGDVAPFIVVSGAAVHSHVVEAFALLHLLACQEGVDPERVLVEPCADHTHTNLRNVARWVDATGGRAAYLMTDDWIQSEYLQDWSGFELILGSIDQRSLRDWGYVIGSWRQASVGNDGGFWFTPYRFWAEPRDGLGSMTCADLD